ncbi:unnamed protein product [Phyllotreta striolata]|uniref:Glycine-rich protein n=1 Tax=Phyllotreta striolata TaxID=444603 RepID=A0A9N9U0R1_PHYSR|nr:unnamed protein product [Phyllotreta striolata]
MIFPLIMVANLALINAAPMFRDENFSESHSVSSHMGPMGHSVVEKSAVSESQSVGAAGVESFYASGGSHYVKKGMGMGIGGIGIY